METQLMRSTAVEITTSKQEYNFMDLEENTKEITVNVINY